MELNRGGVSQAQTDGPPASESSPGGGRYPLVLRTGSPWRDLPEAFGPWATVWDLFDAWNRDGTLQAILDRLRGQVEIDGELWCVDGTIVRAARCAAGGGKKTIRTNRKTTRLAVAVAV